MKIAVCDDDKQWTEEICRMLRAWGGRRDVRLSLFCCTNGDDLLDAHKRECMDLIFLDVVMPLLNGIETAKELRRRDTSVPIVFLSSSKEFAVESYEVKAFSYLLKPLDNAKLDRVLDDLFENPLLADRSFTAQTADGFCKIPIANVCYLEAQNKRVLVHLADGRTVEIRKRFSECLSVFSEDKGFYCCHRSYIVNLNYVEEFTKTGLITTGRSAVPISRNKYAAFKEAYFRHMFA